MKKIELLSPAGNLEKLKIALAYGADAVYGGVSHFSLRIRSGKEFTFETFKEGIDYAHSLGKKVYVTIDIDAFCPSIAPGTGTPSHGGFLYYEVLEMLQEISKKHEVIGIDLVEVAPDYDQSGSTSILAAQLLMNFIGFIFHNK